MSSFSGEKLQAREYRDLFLSESAVFLLVSMSFLGLGYFAHLPP